MKCRGREGAGIGGLWAGGTVAGVDGVSYG